MGGRRNWASFGALILTAALGACGGGGGGGGGGAVFFPVLPATPAATTVTLSGTATYEAVPNTAGPLVYADSQYKPVRGAVVEILDTGGALLSSTMTDAKGAYSATVPANANVVVRVKAQAQQTGSSASWDVSVRDNTQGEAIYAMETPAFATGTSAVTRDLQAPSGWNGASYAASRVAGPFALLDTIYTAQSKILSVAPQTSFPPLRVFWSINNVPARGDPAAGQIGTTYFTSGSSGRAIYVLGKENVDTDEYDASVVAHEWGHYFMSAFSRDDSPGGSHALSELLDRRLAFSEGWGNAWSGIALERRNYTDSVGARQSVGSNIDLSAGASPSPGWFREASAHSILWNFNSQAGFRPIYDTLVGPFKTTPAVTSMHAFSAAMSSAAPASVGALTALMAAQDIHGPYNDPFGSGEYNDGGIPTALPMYRPAAVGGAVTQACVTSAAGRPNKLGSYAYLRFTVPTARAYTISVAGPSTSDPDFVVYSGARIGSANAIAPTETASVALPAAQDIVLAINDFNNTTACFDVTIQ